MDWLSRLDRRTMPMKRLVAELTAPHPGTLGHPLFSTRISDRIRRWKTERHPNPYSAIASKTNGQAYMRSLGHAVPETYGVYPSLDEIPRFEDLPENVVLKPTHGWSAAGVFLLQDGVDWIRKRRFSRDDLIHAARIQDGPARKAIAGTWVAEELLFDFHDPSRPALDYKFFCFGPKVVAIQIIDRSSLTTIENPCWNRDPDWRPLPFRLKWDLYPQRSMLPEPPFLDEMLKIVSEVAGRLNIFIRIDMYATDRGPVFGEFTAYPSNGLNFTPQGDAWLGSHWTTIDGGL
jgi:TupA-like ATPgrasp